MDQRSSWHKVLWHLRQHFHYATAMPENFKALSDQDVWIMCDKLTEAKPTFKAGAMLVTPYSKLARCWHSIFKTCAMITLSRGQHHQCHHQSGNAEADCICRQYDGSDGSLFGKQKTLLSVGSRKCRFPVVGNQRDKHWGPPLAWPAVLAVWPWRLHLVGGASSGYGLA